jgi:hypothetical protein
MPRRKENRRFYPSPLLLTEPSISMEGLLQGAKCRGKCLAVVRQRIRPSVNWNVDD